VILLGIPLGLSLRDLVIEEKTRALVSRLVRVETYTFKEADVRRLRVDSNGEQLSVNLEVAAPEDSITAAQIDLVHAFLERELERPISLDVSVFPVIEYSIEQNSEVQSAK
ncbi:MAG: hypothetical protein WBA01_19020, partial [Phormidesmis sp.]